MHVLACMCLYVSVLFHKLLHFRAKPHASSRDQQSLARSMGSHPPCQQSPLIPDPWSRASQRAPAWVKHVGSACAGVLAHYQHSTTVQALGREALLGYPTNRLMPEKPWSGRSGPSLQVSCNTGKGGH